MATEKKKTKHTHIQIHTLKVNNIRLAHLPYGIL